MDYMPFLFSTIGILIGMAMGFITGVLYATGLISFRIRLISRFCCWWAEAHEWRGLPKWFAWDECKVCNETKEVTE